MGSGKSTAGKKLASLLKAGFIDLDAYIEKKEGRSIPAIFEKEGEKKFREIETLCLREVLDLKEPHVIALGGGTICSSTNLEAVRQKGLLVYLELTPAALAERIRQSRNTRPLLKDLAGDGLLRHIETLLQERKKFYEQAHVIINGLNATPQIIYSKIFGSVQENIS